jgi:hypothetical protein
MPTPPTGRCQEVVQATWYLTFSVGRWPTFAELDRWVDRHNDIEIVEAIREMPPGILYGVNPDRYMTPSDDQEIGLTAAGIAACPDTEEILSVYVEFVRLATEVEKYWQPPLDAPNARPDLTDVDFASNSRLLPAAGRDDVLQLVLLIIKTEGAGWAGLSRTNDGHWAVSFTRDIRRFRGIANIDDYWSKRYKPWEPQPQMPARPVAPDEPETISPQDSTADASGFAPIFVSHAHADRPLADLLRDTLVLAGVPERRIFYSSSRATGIPSGEDVRTYLQRSLREAGLVIELISETFLTRPYCLMELGGAWTLGTPTYPMVVPPLTREIAAQQIGSVQMGILGTESDIDDLFDELHDRLAKDVNISAETKAWNRAIRRFKQALPEKLAEVAKASSEVPSSEPTHGLGRDSGT